MGRELKRLRVEHDLTVRELGTRIGKSAGYVGQIETQGEVPTPDLIRKLAEVLGEQPDGLLAAARKSLLAQTERHLNEKYAAFEDSPTHWQSSTPCP
ncbi:MAG: hypothetical protein DMG69_08015 [Acidobacteria bacterium]|nr:MAG: hypothetical protein DMG69_08015 [Acidobacteriota bacterium]